MKNELSFDSFLNKTEKIAVVGLGYVGLPLAVHLSRHFSVTGYDINTDRIAELRAGYDSTMEVTGSDLQSSTMGFTTNPEALSSCRLIIVAVPTPIDEAKSPDLTYIRNSSTTVGKYLSQGSCVVFESTVYPGVTEDICVPILEKESGLKFGKDFSVGYSPERINPGDKVHTIETITKIVSASDPETLALLTQVYGRIVNANIHQTSSIKVAEAAKVIENTQRDINIALINELSIIFNEMGIDTLEVLEAAGTKWNFLPFRPGLVGGHCIGVDPYYLTFKAESLGYHPQVILAGRRINDGMGKYIAGQTIKMLIAADKHVKNAKVAVLGLTFKENIPDLRNTKVADIINELKDYGGSVIVHDPHASAEEAYRQYGLKLQPLNQIKGVDAVILAVAHREYQELGLRKIAALCSDGDSPVVDVKGMFKHEEAKKLNINYWRL
ncbi:MAG: nucleotide sugar dehydrogenase [Syntrophales bacterium]|nr:nucleotide sugar dehydrogenase [Syntrophales bacterium]